MSSNVKHKLMFNLKRCNIFARNSLNENAGLANVSQQPTFIRFNCNDEIIEELLLCVLLQTYTTSEIIFYNR